MLNKRKFFVLVQIGLMLFFIGGLTTVVTAQKKPVKKPVPKATPKPAASLVVKDEAEKVSIQIKNLTRFIFVLGGTAQTIEDIDKDPKASPTVKQKSNAGKQTLIQTIKNMRAAMVQLENDFHAKPELRSYILYIQGVSEIVALAEDQAIRGQFNNAGKTMLDAVNKLTDTLLNLR
jgi:uncharacterized alpha/beta hydrolase family protein